MSPEKILAKIGITKVISGKSDDTVEQALRIIEKHSIRAIPILDENGVFQGMFSAHEVIKSLVPSYMMSDIQSLDFATGASSVLASRLRKVFPSRVGDYVSAETSIKITTKTGTWEALRMLVNHGSPLPIIDPETGVLKGLISEQSAIEALLKMEADEAELEN